MATCKKPPCRQPPNPRKPCPRPKNPRPKNPRRKNPRRSPRPQPSRPRKPRKSTKSTKSTKRSRPFPVNRRNPTARRKRRLKSPRIGQRAFAGPSEKNRRRAARDLRGDQTARRQGGPLGARALRTDRRGSRPVPQRPGQQRRAPPLRRVRAVCLRPDRQGED